MVNIYCELQSDNPKECNKDAKIYTNGMPVFGEFIAYKNPNIQLPQSNENVTITQNSDIKGLVSFKIIKEITESLNSDSNIINVETNKDIIKWWAIITMKDFHLINGDADYLDNLVNQIKKKVKIVDGVLYPDGTYDIKRDFTFKNEKEVNSKKYGNIYKTVENKSEKKLVILGEQLVEFDHILIEIAFLNILQQSKLLPRILYENITGEYIDFITSQFQTILINEGSFKLNISVFLKFIEKIIIVNNRNKKPQVLHPMNYLIEYLKGVMWHVEYYVNMNPNYFYWYYFYNKNINPFDFKYNRDFRYDIATELQDNYSKNLEYFKSDENYSKLYNKLDHNQTYYISDLKKLLL